MASRLRTRIRIEAALAAISLVLCIVTAISAKWIEALTGLEPDAGSGALEWAIALGFGAVAVASFLMARRDQKRLSAALAQV